MVGVRAVFSAVASTVASSGTLGAGAECLGRAGGKSAAGEGAGFGAATQAQQKRSLPYLNCGFGGASFNLQPVGSTVFQLTALATRLFLTSTGSSPPRRRAATSSDGRYEVVGRVDAYREILVSLCRGLKSFSVVVLAAGAQGQRSS